MAVNYPRLAMQMLSEYRTVSDVHSGPHDQLIFDQESGNYLLIRIGWEGQKRIYHVVIHLEVSDGKIRIHRNQTDRDIEAELIEAGAAQKDIILELVPPEYRAMVGKP